MLTKNSQLASEYKRLKAAEELNTQRESLLPHLYAYGWYRWALDFLHTSNKVALLTAGNQLSKSSSQIRKMLHWATETTLWPKLWDETPTLFWYLYPSQAVINQECATKWEPKFMPRGPMKDDPKYGWKWIKEGYNYKGIAFKSGILLLFKAYSQKSEVLQTASVHYLGCDEELDVDMYDELMFRTAATKGYFSMVFTATKGQDFWRRAMEPREGEEETLTMAWKRTVSAYDCLEYVDGRKSPITLDWIAHMRALCKNETEVQKRIYGRFIKAEGRVYPAFDMLRHVKNTHHLPKGWFVYAGVDIGSGGSEDDEENGARKKPAHPSAIAYVGVSPDFTQGRVFLGWRGDGIKTIAGDVFEKYQDMVAANKLDITQAAYDYAAADFGTIAQRSGVHFTKAIKKREDGIGVLNTLFQNDMLYIYDSPELMKLANELATVDSFTDKRHAKDDFCDALRYAVIQVPWAFEGAELTEQVTETEEAKKLRERRDHYDGKSNGPDDDGDGEADWGIEEELNEWAGYLE
jgi:phage terminase large subunit-like protein